MNKIPKTIHYCWFGKKPLTELAEKCIKSWDKYLPDYKRMLWNEETFDVNSNRFTKEAYECKKYAFVSDYVRLYSLYNHGGIYMDTDVEVVKNLDKFLAYSAFSGIEKPDILSTGAIGSVSHHPWIGRLFEHYKDRPFIREDGSWELVPNVHFVSQVSTDEFGLKRENVFQILKNDVYVFPNDYFCPKDWRTGETELTENTYTIHHFAGSWL